MKNLAQAQEITVPVLGMNCTSCVSHIETALMTLPGISGIHVELQASQVSLNYDPALVDLIEIQRTMEQAGYTIPAQTVTLRVSGMRCVSCVAHVQGALQDLPGCISAEVSLSQGNAQVEFIPSLITISEFQSTAERVGYSAQALTAHQETRDTEKQTTAESKGLFAWMRKKITKPGS